MGEVSKTIARKPEVKRDNSVSRSQKSHPPHSASSSVDRIMFLQKTAGNQAVQKLIKSGRLQTNLKVSQPGDIYEQKAERVAQQVVSSTKLEGAHTSISDGKKNKSIQLRTQHSSDTTSASVPENFIPQLGYGQPINPSTKRMLESHIDADLSNVRVHSDPASHEAAKNLNARAFTYKNDIYLGSGESQNNVKLMAHEATHAVQQGAVIQRSPDDEVSTSSNKGFLGRAKDAVLEKIDKLVVNIPGFSLLCFILRRNPVTDKPVERNAINLIRGVLGLVPGGEALFENLQKSGAIEDAFAWLNAQIEKLNLTWEMIKGLFKQAWDALSIIDVANPSKAFERIRNIFGPTLVRIKNFAVAVGQKIFDFIFEGVLKLAGPLGTKVLGIIRKAGDTVSKILKDPIGFLGNLVQAIRKGFDQFSANILTHLKEGLMKWLFGALSGTGLRLPAKFDLMGILSIVLQVIGLTYAKLREKLVKILGEKPVAFIETAFEFLSLIVTKGLTAAWEKFLEFIGDLKEMVLGAIRDWVAGSIIKKAITKLVSMFNPVGAIIQAIMMTYDAITFFIERAKQVGELAEAVFDSVANIATGNLGAAANYVEKTMARTIPVIIGFLASLIGLGGISEKIKKIIEGIHAKVEKALDKIVNFIVTKVEGLLAKGKESVAGLIEWWKNRKQVNINGKTYTVLFEGAEDDSRLHISSSPGVPYSEFLSKIKDQMKTEAQKSAHTKAEAIGNEINKILNKGRKKSKDEANSLVEHVHVIAELLKTILGGEEEGRIGTKENPLELIWPKPRSNEYPVIYLGGPIKEPCSQDILKSKFNDPKKENKLIGNNPVKEYRPHEGGILPKKDGTAGVKIGISNENRVELNDIVGPVSAATTPGGDELIKVLEDYGFRFSKERMDADHVREIQVGGLNKVDNLWPLGQGLNRSGGSKLSKAEVKYPNSDKKVKISELKTEVRSYFLKIIGFDHK